MSTTFTVKFTTTIEVIVHLEADNSETAEFDAAILGEQALSAFQSGAVQFHGSLDGLEADEVTEAQPPQS